MERKAGNQKVCRKSKCRNAWKAGLGFGRFAESTRSSSHSKQTQEVPANQSILSESKPVDRPHRPWRQIAGPPLTASQFHCAILPGIAMDEVLRIEAKNKAALKTAEQAEIEADGYFAEPEWREVISPDGVKCFVTRWCKAPEARQHSMPPIPDDLSIPEFLLRRPYQDQQQLAA